MANSVDPDETARYKPSHLNLHCLHRYLFWSAGLKGFKSLLFSFLMSFSLLKGFVTELVSVYVNKECLQISQLATKDR